MADRSFSSGASKDTASPDTLDSAETVANFRARAREAAAASVHHATLSEQYLQLSQKFDALAERSHSVDASQLQESILELQRRLNSKAVSGAVSGSLGTRPMNDLVAPQSSAPQSSAPPDSTDHLLGADGSQPKAMVNPFDDVKSGKGDGPEGSVSSSSMTEAPESSISGEALRKGKRKPDVRKIVERNRKVKLAGRRVRVKARRSDLKPRLRTALQELKEGRSGIATGLMTVVLVGLALYLVSWELETEPELDPIISGFAEEEIEEPEPIPIEPPEEEHGEQLEEPAEDPVEEPEPKPEEPAEPEPEPEQPVEEPMEAVDEEPPEMDLPETVAGETPVNENASKEAAMANNRSEAGKAALLAKYGGSAASESAVSRGLDWLVSVQHPQGYWDFPIVGQASSPGTINNPIGGTAYALLPFLAAGQTHQEGKYSRQVGAGLTYLTKIGVVSRAGYDLRGMINKQSDDKEPNEAFYVHGAATLVLCEAYGMTKDRRLRKAAEGALKFIILSQDPQGGGWRYVPGEPGSVSVTAIQVMALMAGKKAGLRIPDVTLQRVHVFLDGLQVDREGRYGYQASTKGNTYTGARTAMALLCRMYLGWGRDKGDMQEGVALLDKAGPYDNLYSLYFATQVMKNWGGEEWKRWNDRLHDDLIAQQETQGPAAGSWKPRTRAIHATQGGRLLTTSLAILTLQVYYRYKPLLPEE